MNSSGKSRKIWVLSRIALLMVGVIWGSSLVVVKSAVGHIPPNTLIAIRFSLAFFALAAVFFPRLKLVKKSDLWRGAVMGACLSVAYWVQTVGVTLAMPGKSGFLSSIYCVLLPFVYWMIGGKKPELRHLAAALLCVTGIVLSSVTSEFSIVPGDALALLSGFFFAAHIAAVGRLSGGHDCILLTILQFGFCAVFSWTAAFLTEDVTLGLGTGATGSVLYLAFICTAVALLLQNVGQKYATPASSSILMSTESVFGILFSVLFLKETLSPRLILGFAFIFVSVLVSELPPEQLRKLLPRRSEKPRAEASVKRNFVA